MPPRVERTRRDTTLSVLYTHLMGRNGYPVGGSGPAIDKSRRARRPGQTEVRGDITDDRDQGLAIREQERAARRALRTARCAALFVQDFLRANGTASRRSSAAQGPVATLRSVNRYRGDRKVTVRRGIRVPWTR